MQNNYEDIVRMLIEESIDYSDYEEFYNSREEAIKAILLDELEKIDIMFSEIQKEKEDLSFKYLTNENIFKEANYNSWKEAFEQTESFIVILEEIFYDYRKYLRTLPDNILDAKKNQYNVFFQLYARTFQEFLEIFTLLKNGFANGAYSRWRTLNERAVIATFISTSKNPEDVSEAFINSAYDFDNESKNDYYNWAKVDLRFVERINNLPKEKRSKAISENIRFSMLKNACPTNQIYFAPNEYQFASSILHASPKGTFHSITEPNNEENIVIGQSSLGIYEPAISAIRSLLQMTKFHFSVYGSNDIYFYIGFLSKWDELLYETYTNIYIKTKDLPIKEADRSVFI